MIIACYHSRIYADAAQNGYYAVRKRRGGGKHAASIVFCLNGYYACIRLDEEEHIWPLDICACIA